MNLDQWQRQTKTSNKALAERVGIDASYVSYIRAGKRRVSPRIALLIEEATKGMVTRMELLYPENEKGRAA